MRIVLLVALAVSVAFAQFAQSYPQQQQQYQQYTTRYNFQQPGYTFRQYRTNTQNNGYSSNNGYNTNTGYGTTGYSNNIYGTTSPTTQYGQYGQYGYGTTPSTYGTTNNYGYGTTSMGRQYDQNGYWNSVGSTTALMAVITTAVAYIL